MNRHLLKQIRKGCIVIMTRIIKIQRRLQLLHHQKRRHILSRMDRTLHQNMLRRIDISHDHLVDVPSILGSADHIDLHFIAVPFFQGIDIRHHLVISIFLHRFHHRIWDHRIQKIIRRDQRITNCTAHILLFPDTRSNFLHRIPALLSIPVPFWNQHIRPDHFLCPGFPCRSYHRCRKPKKNRTRYRVE